jgi:uncharacterized membrane protein YdbT with pleckstrin-like domain
MGYVDRLMGNNERIIFLTRQHWLVLVWTALQDGVLLLLALAAALVLKGSLGAIIIALCAFVVVFAVVHFTWRYLNWHNEQFIITNRRVMEVRGIINKRVSDSSLEKVNDVVLEQSILGRFLNYGMVEIITGSDIGVNIFRYMAQPVRFKTEMLNQKEGLTKLDSLGTAADRVLSEEPPTQGDIPELIAELDELRRRGIITEKEFAEKKAELLKRI